MIIIFSSWNLWKIKKSENDTNILYSSLAGQVDVNSGVSETVINDDDDDDVNSGYKEPVINQWLIDMKEQNRDTVGWIEIPDTVINYPVMQTKEDNDFYLDHNFERSEDKHGTPFLDVNCRTDESDNLIIYGHHMKDGTMFQNLMLYKDTDFCEKNDDIKLYTPERNFNFRPVCVMVISSDETEDFPYYKYINFSDEKAFSDFFEKCRKYSIWISNDLPDYGEKLLTLSTCEYSKENGRLVVIAKNTD